MSEPSIININFLKFKNKGYFCWWTNEDILSYVFWFVGDISQDIPEFLFNPRTNEFSANAHKLWLNDVNIILYVPPSLPRFSTVVVVNVFSEFSSSSSFSILLFMVFGIILSIKLLSFLILSTWFSSLLSSILFIISLSELNIFSKIVLFI